MDPIAETILQYPIIHGRWLCNEILSIDQVPQVDISDDLKIVTVLDKPSSRGQATINSMNFEKQIVEVILVDEYVKWISKIEAVKNYLEQNYDSLPKYFLYIDGIDVLILKDILNPQEYLDFYNCKVLFNSEPYFHHTGFAGPTHTYFDTLYTDVFHKHMGLNEVKYGHPFQTCINAGVFLGEKSYVLDMIQETYSLMKDDFNKGFPHGCMDDQCLLRYIHTEHPDNISVDVFNKLSFWGGKMSFDGIDPTYAPGTNDKFLEDYLKIKK